MKGDGYARVGAIMIDCHDPEALFEFWSQIVGVEIEHRYPDYIFTTTLPGNRIRLAFQEVPEDKVVKNRLHLDLAHTEPEVFIARVESLGGSRIEDHQTGEFGWTVLADPEGNEFCVTAEH
jgi:predicted enzyme related to lactoylglutathione lyase